MIEGLKPYPEYEDSGVEWLGKVPVGWEVRRLRNVVDLRVSNVDKHVRPDEEPVRVCNYVDVYKNDRITNGLDFMRGSAGSREVERFRLRAGDVLITKDSESWDDIASPALVEYEAPDLVCGYHLAILRPKASAIAGPYLIRAVQSTPVAARFHTAANGVTRFGLTHNAIKGVELPCPPVEDQLAISRVLERFDEFAQRYISAKQQLVELLDEEKQAIIHRAITRGLDPDVRLKPSGVDWLGDVPEHWEVRRIKSLSPVKRGASPRPIDDPAYFDDAGTHAWVRIADVTASDRFLERTTQRLSERGKSKSVSLEPGALFLSIAGSVGKPIIANIDCCIHDGFVYFPQYRRHPRFLFYVFALKGPYAGLGKMGTQLNLNTETVGSIAVAMPPMNEQHEIVGYLDSQWNQVIHATTTIQRQIDLLDELRTRLVSDVVTGKLDVRDAAANLPDDPDGADPRFDEAIEEALA